MFFSSEEHVSRWYDQWNRPRGESLSIATGWQLAVAWYGEDRREPSWRRKSLDEVKQTFEMLGLTSSFWTLP